MNATTGQPLRPALSRFAKALPVVTLALLVSSWLLLLLFPACSQCPQGEPRFVTVNTWSTLFFHLAFWTGVTALVVSVATLRARRRVGWVLLAAVLTSPLVCLWAWFMDFVPFGDFGYVRDHDGAEYHMLYSSFGQGSEIVLGRLRERILFDERIEALAVSSCDEEVGYLSGRTPSDCARRVGALHDPSSADRVRSV